MSHSRSFQPLKLDVAAFAEAGAELQGEWPLAELPRLTAGAVTAADTAAEPVTWRARGETRKVGGARQPWLHLGAHARLLLPCQRCLQPVAQDLEVDRWIRFVEGEEQAAEIDEESEDDVLALPRSLDLRWLLEDELILELPLVPRHEDCSPPAHLAAAPEEEEAEADKPNPFASLAALKKKPGGLGGA